MSGWSDPQKGGRAVGAALYPTLSSLLSTAPQPGMRATGLDAPGSMLYEVGGKWGGSFGYVSALQVATLQAAIASIAIGAEAVVPNAAVPGGVSRLRRGAAVWAPPADEPIIAAWGISGALVNIVPAVTTLTQIWVSPIVPDYMIPQGVVYETRCAMAAYNAAGVSGCQIGVFAFSGSVPTPTGEWSYDRGISGNPISGISIAQGPSTGRRRGDAFDHSNNSLAGGSQSASSLANGSTTFVPGSTRAYAMAKPSGVADRIVFDGMSVVSLGGL